PAGAEDPRDPSREKENPAANAQPQDEQDDLPGTQKHRCFTHSLLPSLTGQGTVPCLPPLVGQGTVPCLPTSRAGHGVGQGTVPCLPPCGDRTRYGSLSSTLENTAGRGT